MRLDYLSFTTQLSAQDVILLLQDQDSLVESGMPRQGYRAATIVENGITVLYDGATPGMGTHVVVSGGGCDLRPWKELVQTLKGSVARVDIAFDIDGLKAVDLKAADEADCVQTALRGRAWFQSDSGQTYAFGSRQSDTYVRGYDKRGPLRLEYEFKRDRAKIAWSLYCKGDRFISEYCAASLRVVQAGSARRRDRPMASWFRQWVSETSKRTPAAAMVKTVGDVIEYVCRAVGSALALLESQGVAVSELVEHLKRGKLSVRHVRLLRSWYRDGHGCTALPLGSSLRLCEGRPSDSRRLGLLPSTC